MALTMERDSTDKRIDDLNLKVDQGFERLDSDIRALRAEARAESSALRGEIRSESAALRAEMKAGFDSMNERFDSINDRFDSINDRFDSMGDSLSRRFEAMHRLLLQFCGGLLGAIIVAGAGLIATQL